MNFVIAYAKFTCKVPLRNLQNEVLSLQNENWKDHYKRKDYEGDWNILSLRSPDGELENIMADLIYQTKFENTPFMHRCPTIDSILQQFKCEIKSVRLMNLKAGAVIKKHRDGDLSYEKGECRIHIPVFTNPDVEFMINGEQLVMDEGTCWYMNANLMHSVANNGQTNRIHLVFDCVVNDWLKGFMQMSEHKLVEEIIDTKNWHQTIATLKASNDETFLKLAVEMEMQLNDYKKRGIVQ